MKIYPTPTPTPVKTTDSGRLRLRLRSPASNSPKCGRSDLPKTLVVPEKSVHNMYTSSSAHSITLRESPLLRLCNKLDVNTVPDGSMHAHSIIVSSFKYLLPFYLPEIAVSFPYRRGPSSCIYFLLDPPGPTQLLTLGGPGWVRTHPTHPGSPALVQLLGLV